MSNTSVLDAPVYTLLQEEPFFANFLLGCKVTLDVPGVGTAGVRVSKGQIHMVVNTEWFNSMKLDSRCAVLKHEILHVLLEHCSSRKYGSINHEAKNVAMDCAINQYIKNLPEGGITLEKFCEIVGNNKCAPFEPWEYYYGLMLASKKIKKVPAVDHDFMDGGDGEDGSGSEAENSMNNAAVKDLANKALMASAGKVPDNLASVLGALNKVAQLPWKQILRNFVANARTTTSIPTRQRINRRFGFDQPGKKKDRKLILGVCTDSSGSVSDEDYMKFMQEIHTLAKSTSITFLVQADCEVQKVDIIKGGKPTAKQLGERAGHGGTAYQPAIDECRKRKCDAIIYFGDFDCADTPQDPHVPFLWVGVGDQKPPAEFGKVLRLT